MWVILFLACLIILLCCYSKNRDLYVAAGKFPGPRAYPLLGNSLDFFSNSNGIFRKIGEFSRKYERFFRVWNNGKLFLICYDYRDAEVLLSSNKELKKTDSYRFLKPWIGDGLVASSDIQTWRLHRKIITPTFHFKILHDFLDVFNRNAQILCQQLESKVGKGVFDITEYVKLMALDNICETAMGVNMNAQLNSESAYVKAVQKIANIVSLRFYKVWLMVDLFFGMSKYGKLQKECLRILHGSTDSVIRQRREKLSRLKLNDKGDAGSFCEKRKLAFLDLLLESEEGSKLSDKELREEVDTFMFAVGQFRKRKIKLKEVWYELREIYKWLQGQDTVSIALCSTFYCFAHHKEVQEMAYNEQLEVLGDSKRAPTYAEIQEMKYLDRVLKEVLRLYPSAPIIGRELSEDLELYGAYKVPKGTQMVINIYALHRDPKNWPDPETFNPDNFLPEAVESRKPYSYIPFSAGARNCLGQKYAMLLLKATFSLVLRQYKILVSPHLEHEMSLAAEVTLASTNGCHIQIQSRN